MTSEVGGFLGAGKTTCQSKFAMDRTDYYAAEKVRVRINIDNTDCKKDIKEIKIKLERIVSAVGDGRIKTGERVEHIQYIGDFRFGGLKAGHIFDNDVWCHFPDEDLGYYQSMKIDLDKMERQILESFTCTTKCSVFEVKYLLRCFVKHDAWNDFGEGNFVEFPINMLARPPN